MEIFVYFVLSLFIIRLIIVASNFVTKPVIPPGRRLKEDILISILIRADHYSPKLGFLLELLSKITNPKLEIILGMYDPVGFNNENLKIYLEADKRIKIIHIKSLKKDWKEQYQINYILGNYARGNYILFLDQDIELRGGIFEQLIAYMKLHKVNLITLFPYYSLHKDAEWLTLPILNNICLSTFPIWKIMNSSNNHYVLASEYFMFFDGDAYRHFQPFDKVHHLKNAYQIARSMKKEGMKVDFFIADKRVRLPGDLKMKRCITEIINQILLYVKTWTIPFIIIYAFLLLFWWIFFLIGGYYILLAWGLIILILTQTFIASLTQSTWKKSILYMIPQFFMVLYIAIIALIHRTRKYIRRKTRFI